MATHRPPDGEVPWTPEASWTEDTFDPHLEQNRSSTGARRQPPDSIAHYEASTLESRRAIPSWRVRALSCHVDGLDPRIEPEPSMIARALTDSMNAPATRAPTVGYACLVPDTICVLSTSRAAFCDPEYSPLLRQIVLFLRTACGLASVVQFLASFVLVMI